MSKFRKTIEVQEEVATDVTTTEEEEKKALEEDSVEKMIEVQVIEAEAEDLDFLHLIDLKERVVLIEVLLTEVLTETLQEEEILQDQIHQDVLHLQEVEVLIQDQDVQEEAKNNYELEITNE